MPSQGHLHLESKTFPRTRSGTLLNHSHSLTKLDTGFCSLVRVLWLIVFFFAIIPAHASPPAPPGNPRWLRAPFLGRQHQRNLRAPRLLRRLLLARPLSSRKT